MESNDIMKNKDGIIFRTINGRVVPMRVDGKPTKAQNKFAKKHGFSPKSVQRLSKHIPMKRKKPIKYYSSTPGEGRPSGKKVGIAATSKTKLKNNKAKAVQVNKHDGYVVKNFNKAWDNMSDENKLTTKHMIGGISGGLIAGMIRASGAVSQSLEQSALGKKPEGIKWSREFTKAGLTSASLATSVGLSEAIEAKWKTKWFKGKSDDELRDIVKSNKYQIGTIAISAGIGSGVGGATAVISKVLMSRKDKGVKITPKGVAKSALLYAAVNVGVELCRRGSKRGIQNTLWGRTSDKELGSAKMYSVEKQKKAGKI